MRTVQRGPVLGLPWLLLLLAVLDLRVGLGPPGWAGGLAFGVLGNGLLSRGLATSGRDLPGPADLITLARATLACGVAALVADSLARPAPVPVLVSLAAVALALDWVDGRVARSTGTASPLGARFDMEVDAFLILVLSVYVAHSAGPWVLAIGLARYALLAAEQVLPWLRRRVPVRPWRKVVAAIQGVVLATAAAAVLPHPLTDLVLLAALVLLAESFGRDVLWLSRQRYAVTAVRPVVRSEPA